MKKKNEKNEKNLDIFRLLENFVVHYTFVCPLKRKNLAFMQRPQNVIPCDLSSHW